MEKLLSGFYEIKTIYITLFFSFLLFFPIVLLNQYYLDDNYRSVNGYYAWTGDYRPFADFLYYFWGLGSDFVDLFPFTYIVEFFIVSFFIIKFVEKVIDKSGIEKKYKNILVILAFPIFLNPLFLQNLYFRYDSLLMVLSVIVAIIPFFYEDRRIDFCSLLFVLLTYQPSVWCYTLVICFNALLMVRKGGSLEFVLKYILQSFLIFCLALLIFVIISKFLIEPNGYAESHFESIFRLGFLQLLEENIKVSLSNYVFFGEINNEIFFYLLIGFSLTSLIDIFFLGDSKKKVINFFLFVAVVVVLAFNFLSSNILLYVPRLYPRVYTSFGLLFFIGLFVTFLFYLKNKSDSRVYNFVFLIILLYPVVCFINISFACFNAQYEKNRYEQKILNNIMYDLSTIKNISGKRLAVYGDLEPTFRYKFLVEKYPIISKVSESNFNVRKHRIIYNLINNENMDLNFYSDQYKVGDTEYFMNFSRLDLKYPWLDRFYYNIYLNGNDVFIVLKNDINFNGLRVVKNSFDRFR